MIDRLRHAPEHEADTHAGAEQHGEPAPVAEIRFRTVAAETNLAVATEQQKQDNGEVDIDGQNKKPSEVGGYRLEKGTEQRRQLADIGETEDDEQDG